MSVKGEWCKTSVVLSNILSCCDTSGMMRIRWKLSLTGDEMIKGTKGLVGPTKGNMRVPEAFAE